MNKRSHVSLDSIAGLHKQSYSKISGYYLSLTESMQPIREDILSFVMQGKNLNGFEEHSIGPHCIESTRLTSLSPQSSILDVGCATGDNLALMRKRGFKNLSGVDVAEGMIQEACKRVDAKFYCQDFLSFNFKKTFDLVYAQALIHLFPKALLTEVFQSLLNLSNKRVYFSTTLHDLPSEGIEAKEGIDRYRSRYTLDELLGAVKAILSSDPNLCFHYFFLTDPLGKYWFNGVFEKVDAKAIYDRDGVILYKQFASPKSVEAVLPEIDRFMTHKALKGTYLRYDAESVFDRIENIIPFCSHEMKAIFYNQHAQDLTSYFFGEKTLLLKDKINFKQPGAGKFVHHQDAAAGWQRYGETQLTFALSLDEAHEKNGALYFALGEHKKGLLSPLRTPLPPEVVNAMTWVPVCTKPGDALLFDAYTPHFTGCNTTGQPRRMAFLTYNASKYGDFREEFFQEKRKRSPPMDERDSCEGLFRDQFGKLVYQ